MRLSVRNTDDRELPNLAVTLETEPPRGQAATAFALASDDPRLADRNRPVWILDRGPDGGDAPTRTPGRSARCSRARPARSSGG